MPLTRRALLCSAGLATALAAGQAMAESVTQLPTLTVTATKTEKVDTEVLGAVTTIDLEEIERSGASTLDDLVRHVPNVEFQGGPRVSGEQINIRGLADDRVVIRMDGARNNFNAGHRGRTFIDPQLVKQIDIVRGPTTIYGSGAIGGVLGITTRDAYDFLGPDDDVGFRTSVGYRSGNDEFMKSGSVFGAYEDTASALFHVTSRIAGDVETGNPAPNDGDQRSEVPFSKHDITDGLAHLTFQPFENHRFGFVAEVFNNDQFIPTAADQDTTAIVADRNTRDQRFVLNYDFRSDRTSWVDLHANIYKNSTEITEEVVTPGANFARLDETSLDTYGLDVFNTARFGLSDWSHHTLTFGVEAYTDRQTGTRNGTARGQFPNADADVVGLYVQDEITLFEDFTVMPGVRWDRVELDPSGTGLQDRTEQEVSKSVRVGYRPVQGLQLYGVYAEAFRAPNLTELFATGTHFTIPGVGNNVFITNPDLQAEDATTLEAGFSVSYDDVLVGGDALRGKAAFFETDVTNFIDLQVINNITFIPPFGPTVCDPCTSQSINVRDATLRGGEAELTYDAGWAFAGLGYSQVRGMDNTEGDSLGSIPQDKFVLGLGGRWQPWDLSFGYRLTVLEDQERVPADGSRDLTSGTELHDIWVSWAPSDGPLEGLRVDAGIDNLSDANYRRHLSFLPEEGRNVRVAVSYTVPFDLD